MSETKKCRECLSDIPKQAKKCSQCSSDQRSWIVRNPVKTFFLLLIGIPMILVFFASGTHKPTENTYTSQINTDNTQITPEESLGIYLIDTDLKDGGTPMASVPIYSSPDVSPEKRVTNIPNGTDVELLERKLISEADEWFDKLEFCKIRHGQERGWLNCDWLKEVN